ncbi:uncharacterized protein LOC111894443 [Lactuca sativa]|uniref:uncharacterized protein LOC111894443 n=1 Tax=Lactuca sativa TaxID=4236 RepID=UPI000CD89BEE|nr:uncharacterized protein LOC111894443 [Lactuca sativa]
MGILIDPVRNIISTSNEWWDEKIKEDKEYAKFKDTNLEVYETYYEALFRDTIVVGDKDKVPCEFGSSSTPDDVQFVDIIDGKKASDEVLLFDDVDAFLTYDSSSKKRRGKKLTPRRDKKINFEGKSMDCIGAIDGTHMKASVPQRWEGSAHDTRIFNEARMRREVKFPLPADGKFYLVDTGYPNTKGYLAPYKGSNIHYHIPDFRHGQTRAVREPKGFKENFNYYHSSLRNVIERTLRVWKARWVLLRDMHGNFNFETQVKIVLASIAINNYIRMSGSGDATFQIAQEESYISHNDEEPNDGIEPHDELSSAQRRNDDMHMSAVRDMIA